MKSPEFGMFFMYGAGVVLFAAVPAVGKWWLLAVLAAWLVIQFFCHWYYTLFGASEKKLKGYNACFRNTVHLIPASDYQADPGFVPHDPPSADSVEPCFGDMRDCALEKWEILCMTKFIRRIFAFHNYFWKGCLANVFRYSRGVSCSSFLKRLAK